MFRFTRKAWHGKEAFSIVCLHRLVTLFKFYSMNDYLQRSRQSEHLQPYFWTANVKMTANEHWLNKAPIYCKLYWKLVNWSWENIWFGLRNTNKWNLPNHVHGEMETTCRWWVKRHPLLYATSKNLFKFYFVSTSTGQFACPNICQSQTPETLFIAKTVTNVNQFLGRTCSSRDLCCLMIVLYPLGVKLKYFIIFEKKGANSICQDHVILSWAYCFHQSTTGGGESDQANPESIFSVFCHLLFG